MFIEKRNEIVEWIKKYQTISHVRNRHSNPKSKRDIWVDKNPIPGKTELERLYSEGYGTKAISKYLGVSNQVFKTVLIKHMNVDYRAGIFVTEKLKEIRSINAKNNPKNPFKDWPNKRPDLHKNVKPGRSFGVQGYYKKSNGDVVWLRSCWEYVYAKWLDEQKHLEWMVEPKCIILSNGETYRPDFIVKDRITKREYLVEIKGTFYTENRKHKPLMLKEAGYDIVIIEDITPYSKTSYKEELKKWKAEKLSQAELLEKT